MCRVSFFLRMFEEDSDDFSYGVSRYDSLTRNSWSYWVKSLEKRNYFERD